MTIFTHPLSSSGDEFVPDELAALARLETTPNAIRLRIAGLAPDQIYRGTPNQHSIAEEVAFAVDRDHAYLDAFQRTQTSGQLQLTEPDPGPTVMDRNFSTDLATFINTRRMILSLTRSFGSEWDTVIKLPDGKTTTFRELAVHLAQYDQHMLEDISKLRGIFQRTSGVNALRDGGVAGKLGANLAQ